MTEQRIGRSILTAAALVLGVAGCPPVDTNGDDAGVTGGAANGGAASGGSAADVPECDRVQSLPTQGATCNATGEAHCDASGNKCVCQRGIWYCNASCASTYPTEPSPDSACIRGSACTYPTGVSCVCVAGTWVCTGGSRCPVVSPLTGEKCNGLTGVVCDYPPDTAIPYPMVCECLANILRDPEDPLVVYDAGTGSSWTCAVSSPCPATQPIYSSTDSCAGFARCRYGSTLCSCQLEGGLWCCGTGCFLPLPIQI